MTDTYDSLSSEYFSLPCIKDIESVHVWNGYGSDENIKEISHFGSVRSNSDFANRMGYEKTDGSETSYRHRIVQDDAINIVTDEEVDNVRDVEESYNMPRDKDQIDGKGLQTLNKNSSNPGSSCEEITSDNNSDKGYFSSCDISSKQSRTQESIIPINEESQETSLSLSSTCDCRKVECQTVATIESRGRTSLENIDTNDSPSLNHSYEALNDVLQRPSSLPFGNPPSYMEALRCSPLVYSLPYDVNISRSRASLFTLDSNIYDTYMDTDPTTLENAPRLVAVPSIHAIHTISRSTASTPCVTPDDAILQETVIPASEGFDDHPCAAFCKGCQITVLTTTSTSYRSRTYCCCFLMFFSGVCCPFSFLPFFLCGPKKVFHMCPQCKEVMGVFIDNS